jgi:L-lactate dehydrogenase complex protein LldG
MTEQSEHRTRILGSIRTALSITGGAGATQTEIAAEYAAIPRAYTRSGALQGEALLDKFADRLLEYDAGIYRVSAGELAGVIAEALQKRGKTGLALSPGMPEEWLPQGFAFADASEWDAHQLDRSEGVLSGCTVAIAETGTIVLQNAAAQGRRILSLVPDYHLCIVYEEQIVGTVPEAFDRLKETATLPTTFISGPSATADIEMTRIKGVHGPRFLDVIIVESHGL